MIEIKPKLIIQQDFVNDESLFLQKFSNVTEPLKCLDYIITPQEYKDLKGNNQISNNLFGFYMNWLINMDHY